MGRFVGSEFTVKPPSDFFNEQILKQKQQQKEFQQEQLSQKQEFQQQLEVAKFRAKEAKDLAQFKFDIQQKNPLTQFLNTFKVADALEKAGNSEAARASIVAGGFGNVVQDFDKQQENVGGKFGQLPQTQEVQPSRQDIEAQQSLATKSDLFPTKFKQESSLLGGTRLTPTEIKSEQGIKRAKAVETETAESVKKSFGLTDEFTKANRNYLRTVALFSGIVGQLKGKQKEQGGLGLFQGAFGKVGTKLKVPGFGRTSSFPGQLDETAIGLNSILTGQNRVIKSVVEMIRGTLPTEFDPPDFAASKIAQSITNTFKLNKSFELGILSPDQIESLSAGDPNFDLAGKLDQIVSLSPEDNAELEKLIEGILSTPATAKRTLEPERNRTSGARVASPGLGRGLDARKQVEKAKQLRKQNPNMSKEEIIRRIKGGR